MLLFKTVVWFIIAVARIRFPVDQSLMTVVRKRYDDNIVRLIRRFEKTERRTRKAELDLTFLEKCQQLGVIPKFLMFKVSNDYLRESITYRRCCKSLLNEEVKHKRLLITTHHKELLSIKDELRQALNIIDYTHVVSCLLQGNDNFIKKHKDIQDKKLLNLIEKPNNFKSLIQKMIPWGKVNIVYKTQCRVSQLLRFKDSIPSDLKSHLIYYFKSPSCDAEYIRA